jgi:hypothetical protein
MGYEPLFGLVWVEHCTTGLVMGWVRERFRFGRTRTHNPWGPGPNTLADHLHHPPMRALSAVASGSTPLRSLLPAPTSLPPPTHHAPLLLRLPLKGRRLRLPAAALRRQATRRRRGRSRRRPRPPPVITPRHAPPSAAAAAASSPPAHWLLLVAGRGS